MEHDGAVIGATLLRRCLRAGLLLGGSVVLWWALATGSAHADDHAPAPSPEPGSGLLGNLGDQATRSVADVSEQVRHTARAASEEVRRTTARAGAAVRESGRSAPPPLRAVTQPVTDAAGTTLERTAAAVEDVRATVDGTVTHVVDTVDQQVARTTHRLDTAVQPLPDATQDSATTTPAHGVLPRRSAPTAPTAPDRLVAPHRTDSVRIAEAVAPPAGTAVLDSAFDDASAAAAVPAGSQVPADAPSPAAPPSPGPILPTSSVVASPSFVAMLGALLLAVPLLLQLRRRTEALSLAPAPALLPGCSPD